MEAYDEYMTIMFFLEDEHIRTHTDGGHSPGNKSSDFGIRIVKHEHGRTHVPLRLSDGLGSETISEAEFMAIHEALRWLQHEYKDILHPIHIGKIFVVHHHHHPKTTSWRTVSYAETTRAPFGRDSATAPRECTHRAPDRTRRARGVRRPASGV